MTAPDTGGLRFQTTKSLAVEELLARYDGIIEEADEVLAAEQIAGPLEIPPKPDDLDAYISWHEKYNDPLPPEDLTEAPDLIIGKLFSFFQNWTNYVASTVTRAKCLRDIQKRNLDVLKSALTIYYREEKGAPAGLIKDYINVDPRFVEVDAALLKIAVFYETASSREDQLRRTLNNISREQTRRANELERELHDDRGGRGGPRGAPGGERSRRFGRW
jgi:hypothetical protein